MPVPPLKPVPLDDESEDALSKGTGKDVLTRQWKEIRAIAEKSDGYTVAELSEKFDVNPKTIKRDLKLLAEVFGKFSTTLEAKNAKRYSLPNGAPQLGVALRWDETLALYVGRRLMEPLRGTSFWRGLESGLEKIGAALEPEKIEHAKRVSPYFYRFEPTSSERDAKQGEILDAIVVAIEESRVLKVQYRSVKAKKFQKYDVWPFNIVFYRDLFYLIGYSCKSKEIRIWKLSRFADASALRRKFKRPADFDVESYLANTIAPFADGKKLVRVKIRFVGYAAVLANEEKFGTNRVVTEESPDSIVVEASVSLNKPFVSELLKYGGHAEILEPQELKDAYLEELAKAARVYGRELAASKTPSKAATKDASKTASKSATKDASSDANAGARRRAPKRP